MYTLTPPTPSPHHLSQVEVTKFEDLEETHAEVKMKQNLWDSQRDWQNDYQKWMTVQLQHWGLKHSSDGISSDLVVLHIVDQLQVLMCT